MALNKFLIIFLFSIVPTMASKLPEFATKQDVTNLRFISKDGKFTYYQRSNGEFLLSTNFAVTKVLQKNSGTQFEVTSSSSRKFVIVSSDENFHTFYSMKKNNSLSLIEFGKDKATDIGLGQNPKLHLNDEIVSFFDPYLKTITLFETQYKRVIATIKTAIKTNPYFKPSVAFVDNSQIIYTDINSNGEQAILLLNRKDNKTKVILKAAAPTFKIEVCENQDHIFIGEFPYRNVDGEVIISMVEKSKFDISKRTILYTSKSNDIGNIICDYEKGKISFIKDIGKEKTELAEINISNKEIKILSDLDHVTSVINLDQRLLIPHYGKTYLVKGENNIPLIDTLEIPKKENDDTTGDSP